MILLARLQRSFYGVHLLCDDLQRFSNFTSHVATFSEIVAEQAWQSHPLQLIRHLKLSDIILCCRSSEKRNVHSGAFKVFISVKILVDGD